MINLTEGEALAGIVGLMVTAGAWALTQQAKKTKRDTTSDLNFVNMTKRIEEQEKHLEFQDERFESFNEKLDTIIKQNNELRYDIINRIQTLEASRRENNLISGELKRFFILIERVNENLEKK